MRLRYDLVVNGELCAACGWCCSPESAETTSFTVQEGDIIILGTDGLFDNMKDDMIMKHISRLKVCSTGVEKAWILLGSGSLG